jgi:signal transduction histidine kinase
MPNLLFLRRMLLEDGARELPRHEAQTWFDLMTTYIDQFKEVEDILISDLQQTSLVLRREMMFQFYGLLSLLATVLTLTLVNLWKGERKSQRIRSNLETSLRAEQMRSAQILETMTDSVCVVNVNGAIEYANPAMLSAFGNNALLTGADKILPCVGSEGCALTSQGLTYRAEKCSEAHSAINERGYSIYCTSFCGPNDELSRLVVMNDVTAHMLTEQRLTEAKEAAESANRSKSEIMTNMSHELRTPLNAIIGFSDMMINGVFGRLGCEQYEGYAHDINASGKHLLDLINDILDVSAIEAGKVELRKEIHDVEEIVCAAVRLVMPRAAKGGVEVCVKHNTQTPHIYADGRRFKQILLNLLSNAVKFTPPCGRVDVHTSESTDGNIIITVKDTGVGMTPEEVVIALEPFGQADSGMNRKHEGTGLGLPLTKGLVELHDGTLEVHSEKNMGTTIILTFPPEHDGPTAPPAVVGAVHDEAIGADLAMALGALTNA